MLGGVEHPLKPLCSRALNSLSCGTRPSRCGNIHQLRPRDYGVNSLSSWKIEIYKSWDVDGRAGEKNSKDLIRWPAICYYILLYINTDNAIQFPFSHVLKSKPTEGAI